MRCFSLFHWCLGSVSAKFCKYSKYISWKLLSYTCTSTVRNWDVKCSLNITVLILLCLLCFVNITGRRRHAIQRPVTVLWVLNNSVLSTVYNTRDVKRNTAALSSSVHCRTGTYAHSNLIYASSSVHVVIFRVRCQVRLCCSPCRL